MMRGVEAAAGRQRAERAGRRVAREDVVAALLALWAVTGLALDGRAHEEGGVESFFTVWHLILYTGLGAAAVWTLRAGRTALTSDPVRRLSLVGLGLLAVGGPADLLWHEAFGFEENLEALLSPSHLLLLAGGLLLVTQPLRSAWARTGRDSETGLGPAVASLVLATALIGFFLQYLTPFHDPELYSAFAEALRVRGVASILVTAALVTVPLLLFAVRFGALPTGTGTVLFGGVAVVLSVSSHDTPAALVVAAIVGGAGADLLASRIRPSPVRPGALRAYAVLASLVLWVAMTTALAVGPGLTWPPELWAGSVVLAGGLAFALALLATAVPQRVPD